MGYLRREGLMRTCGYLVFAFGEQTFADYVRVRPKGDGLRFLDTPTLDEPRRTRTDA